MKKEVREDGKRESQKRGRVGEPREKGMIGKPEEGGGGGGEKRKEEGS